MLMKGPNYSKPMSLTSSFKERSLKGKNNLIPMADLQYLPIGVGKKSLR